ncbi:MAG: lycopene cyclase family protein [Ginsengibacter sp.]
MPVDKSKSYDFIFLGAGCAALSIVMRMINSGQFMGKKILLIDRDAKNKNDRTWCFWEKEDGFFENVVRKRWNNLVVQDEKIRTDLDMGGYTYKMIRGLDFYFTCFSTFSLYPDIDVVYGDIDFAESGSIKIDGEVLLQGNAILFNSIHIAGENQNGKYYLRQHFRGWVIETSQYQFDTSYGILMDFSMDQHHGTTFVYLLPLAEHLGLVEYTLFTKNILQPQEYDEQLKKYLSQKLGITDFKIIEKEFGVIPMTNAVFPATQNGGFNIGTAGGQTKPSTGYTFQFIQKQATEIVDELIKTGKPPAHSKANKRFHFYDSTLLHILSDDILSGKEIFTRLFQKNKASAVFKFLDNETSLREDLQIINSLPKKEFLSAGLKEIIKLLRTGFLFDRGFSK